MRFTLKKRKGKNETEKKGVKKVPMQESNPRPLNLQPPPPQGFVARTIIIPTYSGNLNGDELRVAPLAVLAPPMINIDAVYFYCL